MEEQKSIPTEEQSGRLLQPAVGVRRRISSRPIAASPGLEGCGKTGSKPAMNWQIDSSTEK